MAKPNIDKTGGLPHNRRVRTVQDYTNKQVKRPSRKMTNPPRSGA